MAAALPSCRLRHRGHPARELSSEASTCFSLSPLLLYYFQGTCHAEIILCIFWSSRFVPPTKLSALNVGFHYASAATSAHHTVPRRGAGARETLAERMTCPSACGLECTHCRPLSRSSHLLFLTPRGASGPGGEPAGAHALPTSSLYLTTLHHHL